MIYIAVLNNLIVNGSARFLNKLYANDVDIGSDVVISGKTTTGQLVINGGTNVGTLSTTNSSTGNIPVIIGSPTGRHIAIDADEIAGKGSATTAGNLWLNYGGGTVYLSTGQQIYAINGTFTTPNLKATNIGDNNNYVSTAYVTNANITTINSSTISNSGKITANDMEVVDTLKSYKWDISHVANLANDFTVSPTLQLASGATIQFSAINTSTKVCTFTVTDSSSISSDSLGGVTWTQYSKVKFTMNLNDIVNSNCDGYLTVKMNSTAGTLVISGTLDDVTGLVTGTNYNAEGATIMLYEVGAGSQSTTYPVGIRMTAYGSNKRSYIDIYGGTATTSWNSPHVRIGNIGGLTYNNSTLENQWGIYTDNGYFKGAIVSTEGEIGGWSLDNNSLQTGTWGTTGGAILCTGTGTAKSIGGSSSINGWVFTAGANFGVTTSGALYCNSANIQGSIKATSGFIGQNATNGFTISNTAIYNPSTKSSLGSDTVDGVYIGKDGIALGKGVFKVTNVGAVTASNINATGGTIGGFKIDSTSIRTNDVAVTSNADNSIALSSADFTRTINSSSRSGLRFAIGDKFGVTGDGTIYASEAVISGAITASSGYIGTSAAGFTIGADSFYNPSAKSTFDSDTVDGVYIGTGGIALGKGVFKVTNSGALTTSNLKITNGNSYLAGDSNNTNAFYWGTPTNFNVAYKGKYFINTSGTACFNSLYIGGHTVGDNWDEPTYYFTNAGNIKANSVTTNTISGTPVISGFYLHSNKDRGVFVTNDGYVSVYNNSNRVQLSAGSGNNTYRIYAYCSTFYVNNTAVTSDKKIKNHLSYLSEDEQIENFIMSLKPASYTMKNGQSGRKHFGFYAQDIRDEAEATVGDVGIYLASTLDMNDFEEYTDDIPDEEISWSLRYDELIAPLVALVQKQNKEIKDLQNRIAYLGNQNS